MKSNIKITFWLYTAKTNRKRLAPIYVRVTDGNDIFTITTGKYVKPSEWNKSSMRLKGISDENNSTNEYLDAFRNKIQRICSQLIMGNQPFTVHTIKDLLHDNGQNQIKLLEFNSKFLEGMKSLVGTEFKYATIVKYTNTHERLKEFINKKYKRDDLYMNELDFSFMDDFIKFLKVEYKNNQTSCYKHYQRFTKSIRFGVKKGVIDKYPFYDFTIKLPKKEVEFLTMEEINRIDNVEVHNERLKRIQELFIFCCYSGLAYHEVMSLKPSNIILGSDSKRWLYITRQKTGKSYQVPLLPRAEELLDKYLNNNSNKSIFPVPSNVKFNAYLKEIACIAKIDKNLTTHLARKSFSVTIMLTNGVSIGVLSKCLGHSDIKITIDAYSKIVDKRIVEEIGILREKFIQNKKNK